LSVNWASLSKAYTTVYALCYIVSPVLGLRLTCTEPIFSAIGLFTIGLGLIGCLYVRNIYLILFFSAFEAVGCVAHYLQIVPWVPTFSNNAYLVMSVLDFCQAILLLMQAENLWKP